MRGWPIGLLLILVGCGPPGDPVLDLAVDLSRIDAQDAGLRDLSIPQDLPAPDLRPEIDLHYPICQDRSCLLRGNYCADPEICLRPSGWGGLIVPTCVKPCKSGADCPNGMHCVWLRWDVQGMQRYCVSNDHPPLCTGFDVACTSAPGCMGDELCMDFDADNSPACGVECVPCKNGCALMACK